MPEDEHSPSTAVEIESSLLTQDGKGRLRFLTCGSVGDGTSTLLGRLLSKTVFEDQVSATLDVATGASTADLAVILVDARKRCAHPDANTQLKSVHSLMPPEIVSGVTIGHGFQTGHGFLLPPVEPGVCGGWK